MTGCVDACRCVFRIRPQHDYSSAKTLQKVLDQHGVTLDEVVGDGEYAKLFEARDTERANNLKDAEQARGRALRYGMVVQLQHDTSLNYLCVTRGKVDNDPKARMVSLSRDFGEAAWFTVMPKLKVCPCSPLCITPLGRMITLPGVRARAHAHLPKAHRLPRTPARPGACRGVRSAYWRSSRLCQYRNRHGPSRRAGMHARSTRGRLSVAIACASAPWPFRPHYASGGMRLKMQPDRM